MKNTLRVERAIKNITQADLAELIGVSRQTINTIESNKRTLNSIGFENSPVFLKIC